MISLDFVIRSIGERTEEVCIELVNRERQPHEELSILREQTHTLAVQETIRRGLMSKADWLAAIDADMLIVQGGVSLIRDELRSVSEDVFVVHPAVFDKQYGMRRWGVTVYRTSMLDQVWTVFQDVKCQRRTKIEGAVIAEFENEQKRAHFSRTVVAYHDFFQFYRDLYRKAYLNATRNPGMNRLVSQHWTRLCPKNADYLVMLKAMENAVVERRQLTNSMRDFEPGELGEKLAELGLKEKSALNCPDFVKQFLNGFMEVEIKEIERNRVFNDFFEHDSSLKKMRSVFRRTISRSF